MATGEGVIAGPRIACVLACGAAFVVALVLGFIVSVARRRFTRRAIDLSAVALLGGVWAGAAAGAVGGAEGFGATAVIAAATLALSVLLWPTDLLRLPRGLRAGWAAMLVAVVGGGQPLVTSVKLPFSTRFVELGAVGWAVSWLWVWLYGSLFARAGTLPYVVPGLAMVAAAVFWIVGAMQPQVVGPVARTAAMLCTLASAGLLAVHGRVHVGRGTAGAFAIGAFLGVVAALGMLKNTALLALLLPLLVVGMPLFAAVAPRRVAAGSRRAAQRVPGAPVHLHELLMAQGYRPGQIAALELAGAAYLGALAVLLVAIVKWHWAAKLAVAATWLAVGYAAGKVLLNVLPRSRESSGPVEVALFGIRLHALSMDEALERAREFLRSGQPHYIVTCDASGLNRAQEDEEFRRVVNNADLVTADGAGVVLAARLMGLPVQVRVAGCDLVEGLCRVAAEEGESVYFLGAEPGVAEEAARRLQERVPGLKVAGCHDGYYPIEREDEVVEEIAAASPGILFVALGQPRQEFFIDKYLERIGARVAIGIGGSLDVISGRKKRAPVWMQRLGLEWLYRVAKEPWRLPRLRALPKVVVRALAAAVRAPMLPMEGDEQP